MGLDNERTIASPTAASTKPPSGNSQILVRLAFVPDSLQRESPERESLAPPRSGLFVVKPRTL